MTGRWMWRGNRAGPSRDGVPGGGACGPGDGPQGEAGAVTRPSGRAGESTTPLPNGTPAAADSTDADRRPAPVAAPAPAPHVPPCPPPPAPRPARPLRPPRLL